MRLLASGIARGAGSGFEKIQRWDTAYGICKKIGMGLRDEGTLWCTLSLITGEILVGGFKIFLHEHSLPARDERVYFAHVLLF